MELARGGGGGERTVSDKLQCIWKRKVGAYSGENEETAS